jgi:ssDNA-binding replication factor A large subunit
MVSSVASGRRWIKVSEIGPYTRSVNVRVQIVNYGTERSVKFSKDKSTHRVAEFLVGDETAVIYLTLWDDQIDEIDAGKSYVVGNGYANVYQDRLTLNVGRYGQLVESEEPVEDVNEEVNITETWLKEKTKEP